MSRGKGVKACKCYCRACQCIFLASREDAQTCSPRCRKRWNRLMGGSKSKPVTRITGDLEKPESDLG